MRPAIFDTIFFDVGSTLLELNASWEKVYHQIFQRAGYALELGEVEQAIAYSWGIVSQQDPTAFFENTLEGSLRWQQEVEQRVMAYLNIHPDVHQELFWELIKAFEDPQAYFVYPEVVQTLSRLKEAGYRLGVISNWSWHLPDLLAYHNLTPYFDQIITSARVGCAKPNPVIFQTALAQMRADPAHSLHIGDTYRADILGAWNLGLAALWLDRRDEASRFQQKAPLSALQKRIRITSLDQIWPFLETNIGEIIEVAAIKFRLEAGGRVQVLDRWQTFVKPSQAIPYKITNLTGIRQSDVAAAPNFEQIRERLRNFLGDHPGPPKFYA